MMESKEVIEVWRAEFERYHGAHARFDNGRYVDPMDQTLWACWVAAKRSQPVVELPKPNTCYDQVTDYHEKVTDALTAAGIQYKVKE